MTQEAASRALLQSTDILVELFETALTAGLTRVKGMPRRVVNMLVYLIEHDAHHRGQIVMMAGDLGIDSAVTRRCGLGLEGDAAGAAASRMGGGGASAPPGVPRLPG